MPRRYEVCLITIASWERDHLTSLPALDMEHFMYRQGFDDVYHRVAQIPDNVPMNMRRVITKAIHRSSKPDLAIEWRWRPAAVAWTLCRRC
ncbi:OLD family ATP-dependent endonuclease [Klebsiella pneumoniae]|nr:OLD family ATP-dependent endonuclease [Klebsiella pneumoniae]